jgi:Ala-tRNA(Pro) deacylase
MSDLHAFLDAHDIAYERCDHPPAFTVDDVERLVPLGGPRTKNLFLRDKKGARQALVVVRADKPVDLAALSASIAFERPSFGSADRLKRCLGIEPGAVSLLALVNDTHHDVELFVDRDLWATDSMQCHPLVNTATLRIPLAGIARFLAATGHAHRLIDVPEAGSSGSPA